MTPRIRPLAFTTAVGLAAAYGLGHLSAEGPPPAAPPAPPAATAPPATPPVTFTNQVVATRTAVTPKPLSESTTKGLAYLLKNQQDDGGWNQGGGWRTSTTGGGRVEGKEVEDPSDVGNTCFALLALIRSGSTPSAGDHKDAVAKGLRFVLGRVEKAKGDDLYVTDVRNTQLQSKVGPFIDTFLANLVLAELKGKAGDDEKRLVACLETTMTKIVKHQTADGGFAGNGGWAPVLSVSVANKGIARAQQNGAAVDKAYFARAAEQSRLNAAGIAAATPTATAVAAAPAVVGGAGKTTPAPAAPAMDSLIASSRFAERATSGPAGGVGGRIGGGVGGGDAGVRLYSLAQGATNLQDAVNVAKLDADKAREALKRADLPKDEKRKAEKEVAEFERLEGTNRAAQAQLGAQLKNDQFVAGFGSNGGEEFLSFLNISETLVVKGGKEWDEWDAKMTKGMEKAQDKDGSWSGHHCITGKTFCTAGALLVAMADRTPFPVDTLDKAKAEVKPTDNKLPTPGAEKK